MNAGHHTEAELVAALAQGDKTAFEIIYRTYASEIFRHIRRNIAVREDCEEILHDMFEWLWRKRKEVRFTSLRGYLFTMANHRMATYFRKSKVRQKYERHFALFEALFNYLYEDEREETIDPDVLENLIQKSLRELPDRCREAFELRLTKNLSNAEIAQRMNINKGTVENYMVRALSHLHYSYRNLYKAG